MIVFGEQPGHPTDRDPAAVPLAGTMTTPDNLTRRSLTAYDR
jgi:hypothetical protein